MSSDDFSEFIARAARRAAHGPAPMIAGLIEAWRRAFPEQLPEDSIGCSPATLIELSLCLRPREGQWVTDTTDIAEALAIDVDRLVGFLRTAEAVQGFSDAHPADAQQDSRLLTGRAAANSPVDGGDDASAQVYVPSGAPRV